MSDLTDKPSLEVVQAEAYRRRYLADQIETATPEQRLLMLFDRLLRDLDDAAEAFGVRAIEKINDSLVHAQQILFALRDPLDRESDLGAALASVYTYCVNRLIMINLTKDPRELAAVREMIGRIAAANRAAALELAAR